MVNEKYFLRLKYRLKIYKMMIKMGEMVSGLKIKKESEKTDVKSR